MRMIGEIKLPLNDEDCLYSRAAEKSNSRKSKDRRVRKEGQGIDGNVSLALPLSHKG
jgi:hypothetical protein